MIFVYTTTGNKEDADRLAALLVEKKLAARVNSWPIYSTYIWEGKPKQAEEFAVLIKSAETKFQEIEDTIIKNSAKRVPRVAAIEAKRINHEFREWIVSVIG